MSVFKKQTIKRACPAYNVATREETSIGHVNLTANETLVCDDMLGSFTISSVVSSALEYNDDPLEAVERALKNGHKLHFIYSNGTTISACKQAVVTHVKVDLETFYRFEGKIFRLAIAPNNNLKLVEYK